MGILVCSLLWVMQDLYHQQYLWSQALTDGFVGASFQKRSLFGAFG